MLPAIALLAVSPLQFQFVASEYHNAVYHVACLAGSLPCSNRIFVQFWNEELNVAAEDGARFDEWKAIFRRAEDRAGLPEPAPFLPNYVSYFPKSRAGIQILAAAFESRSSAEFQRRAALFLPADEARRLGEIVEQTERRLHPWWIATGRAIAEDRASEIRRDVSKLGASRLAGEMASFLEAALPRRSLVVHVIPGPYPKSSALSATPVRSHFCLEVTEQITTPEAVAVVLHELTHALYETSPPGHQRALMNEFVNAADPSAQPLYAYFNEALATAVQLLLMKRNGLTDSDPYHDRYIPELARAILPALEDSLARGGTAFDGFAARYMAGSREALQAEAGAPRFLLAATALLASDRDSAAVTAFANAFHPRFSVNTEEEARRFENLNVVRLLTYDEVGIFTSEIPGLDSLKLARAFGYSKPRGTKGRTIFLAGRDTDALIDAVRRLAFMPTLPQAEGPLFTIGKAFVGQPVIQPVH